MVYFRTKNPTLGKFDRFLQWKNVGIFYAVWAILRPFGIFNGLLVYFSHFGLLYQENLATLVVTATLGN
jgi:hypothetical protein